MVKTKRYYAERVILGLQNRYPNIDFKIDEREVFPALDDVVNGYAEKNYFDNWKFAGEGIDEQFITTFDNVTVVDQANEQPSYFEFPANYAALPRNRGIEEIWPLKFLGEGKDHSVVIMSRGDWRRYKNMQMANLQGRLGGYPEGNRFYFTTHGVKKKFGNVGVRLVIRDASQISEDAPYPIPGNYEGLVIQACIDFFYEKRMSATDTVRDKNDSPSSQNRRVVSNDETTA
jgi:hypothetical protein